MSHPTSDNPGAAHDGREPGRGAFAHAMARLRAILFLGSTFTLVMLVGFWLVPLAAVSGKANWIKKPCRAWVRIAFALFGLRVDLRGAEHLEGPGHRLFIANHQSFLDIMIMMGWVKWPSFLAKKEIESWPWFGWAMTLLGCVFVDRNDRESRNSVGAAVKASMANGVDFCIFAEGTRTRDGELLPFRPGGFQIAIESGALLTPVVIDPTWRMLNKKGFRLWSGTAHVTVLPPIDASKLERNDRKTLAQEVEASVRAELQRLRAAT